MTSFRVLRHAHRPLLVAAVIVSALNLRTAVTSVGALMPELQAGLNLSNGAAGLLTAMPLLTFAVVGAFAPRLVRGLGEQRALVGALSIMALGLVLRSLSPAPSIFFTCTVLALAGGAIGNVAIPTLVKRRFPENLGRMTAAYATAMAVGQTLAAGLSIPATRFASGPDSWRVGLGVWAILAGLSILPWLLLRSEGTKRSHSHLDLNPIDLLRSRTAWTVAFYFAAQATQVFVVFGWFANFFRDQGVSAGEAGALVAFFSVLFIPISAFVPLIATHIKRQRILLTTPSALCILGYSGMAIAGGSGAWAWITLVALGNSAFPLSLTLFSTRTRDAPTTAALSAFAQSVGYLLAGVGPISIGLLHGATHGWVAPIAFLLAVAGSQACLGLVLGKPKYVEDDLPTATRALGHSGPAQR